MVRQIQTSWVYIELCVYIWYIELRFTNYEGNKKNIAFFYEVKKNNASKSVVIETIYQQVCERR